MPGGTHFYLLGLLEELHTRMGGYNKKALAEASAFSGAATQIRTGDLILTKDALYRLSYNSISHAPDEGGMVATEKGLEPSTSSVTG